MGILEIIMEMACAEVIKGPLEVITGEDGKRGKQSQ